MAVRQAKRRGINNFAVLVSHVLVPPAMTAVLSSPANRVQGFLGAGHVCTVMGYEEYEPLAAKFQHSDRRDRLRAARFAGRRLPLCVHARSGAGGVENQYARAVRSEGQSGRPVELLDDVFEVTDRKWRGIGTIPQSGYRLRPEYAEYDAESRFAVQELQVLESETCISGLILQGVREAPRLSGVWKDLHARTSARGDHGLVRGSVCRLLQLWPIP